MKIIPALCLTLLSASVAALEVLPPPAAWHGASEKLVAEAGSRWITPAERSGFTTSPDYAATLQYLRALAGASDKISVHIFGKSYQGRDLVYALVRKPGGNKPVVMIQAGIHSGEIDGKDAGLMLLRDIAFGGRDDLLDQVDLVFIPILNVDGHEDASPLGRPSQRGPQIKGSRTNAQGLDLNRDYARLQSPEIAAVVKLLQRYDPALYIDVHVSDGTDYQYDVTYTFAGWGTYARSQATAQWLMGTYSDEVSAALSQQGHLPAIYPSWINESAPDQGLRISAEGPRYSTGYGDFIGVPTVLVENHTMKPYKRRVLGTYVLLEQSILTVGRERARIAAAKAEDRAARPAQLMVRWERDPLPLRTSTFKGYRYEAYQSLASGARELRWAGEPQDVSLPVYGVRSTLDVSLPQAWWISAGQQSLIAALRAHGIAMETTQTPRTVALETTRMASGKERGGARSLQQITLPAGSVRIPAAQPYHLLAAALLEAESDDSFLAHGLFDQALASEWRMPKHLLAPLADQMMASNPTLRAEFLDAVGKDAALAANPAARLAWWEARSDYAPRARWLYPVYRELR
ncbi:M14 family metallopeptidase [Duganella sp. sic0402]|uniref:M14 family metallopeptidase n=1 Tax=Duganella sp. sic0402 TaxID=2854786 RepID=UPI001C46F9C5|nr:M14 family metallopeptidase [Duganella sp. sic0402]MBV7538315.1 M14 family metallopeptidase [Duganella sp. sic0402]